MKVLIADDEPLARERLARLVGSLPGYRALPEMASNGHEALQLVEAHHPDILLLDISMKHMSGLDALRQWRTEFPNVQILILSIVNRKIYVDFFFTKFPPFGSKGGNFG